ncbi:MAG: DNA polymerase IV, partial [Myxococcota bacterium]
EETLMHDIYSGEEVRLVLLSQAVQVARRLVLEDLSASVVLVKIKYADFQQRTRQKQLEVPVRDAVSIHEACGALLSKFPSFNQGVRLVGVSTAGLSLGPPPPQLFPDCRGERREALQRTLTELEARVGKDALVPASLLARKQQQAEESSRS